MKHPFKLSGTGRVLIIAAAVVGLCSVAAVQALTVNAAYIATATKQISRELGKYTQPTIYMDKGACGEYPYSAVACNARTISVGSSFMQNQETKYGSQVGKFVLAHEWGHTIQFSKGINNRSPYQELQADCVAGTFAKFAESKPTSFKPFIENAVKSARDYADNSTHGTSSQRDYYARFGYANTVDTCLTKLPQKAI